MKTSKKEWESIPLVCYVYITVSWNPSEWAWKLPSFSLKTLPSCLKYIPMLGVFVSLFFHSIVLLIVSCFRLLHSPFSSVPFLELFSGPDHRSYLDNMTHNCFCCSFSASLPRSLSYITMMVYLQTFFNMTCPKRTDFFASVTFMWEMHYDPIATHRPMWVPQKMNWESMDINRTLAMKLWVKQPQLWTPTFVSIQVVFLISFC